MKTYATPIAAMALFALSGCHHKPSTPTSAATTSPGIVVSDGRLMLPAVTGNPGAAYFTLGNENDAPATLVRVDIVGARQAEMHETVGGAMRSLPSLSIAPGQRVIFAPAGKHVMAFGLAPGLAPGANARMVLHFADGKTSSAPLKIESAGGDDMAGMPGMNMGGKP